MLKAASEIGTKWMTDMCDSVMRDYEMHVDCSKCWLLNVYHCEEDPLTYGSCHAVAGTSYKNQ